MKLIFSKFKYLNSNSFTPCNAQILMNPVLSDDFYTLFFGTLIDIQFILVEWHHYNKRYASRFTKTHWNNRRGLEETSHFEKEGWHFLLDSEQTKSKLIQSWICTCYPSSSWRSGVFIGCSMFGYCITQRQSIQCRFGFKVCEQS